jgi:hypothetical protein
MSPKNPLAMQRYRTRKGDLEARVAAGEISRERAATQLKAFAEELFRRRGDPKLVERKEP